ncbi:hypothetical protein PILCRDRAFT_812342 [Piloderma croceum F 1598]|uniref:Uncharacterized protein n=1 Tax=Piloderma croceum (strain F 1598) TaxID=765440 RepID=A0A0C3BVL8_PILCF|nr:hypothetical protein PILCRDRAFT_812342 [Piloderma croceum F 1598]
MFRPSSGSASLRTPCFSQTFAMSVVGNGHHAMAKIAKALGEVIDFKEVPKKVRWRGCCIFYLGRWRGAHLNVLSILAIGWFASINLSYKYPVLFDFMDSLYKLYHAYHSEEKCIIYSLRAKESQGPR